MRKMTAATVALGVTGVTLVGLAGAASATHPTGAGLTGSTAADTTNGTIKMPTTSYSSPSNQSAPVHALSPNTPVQIRCFTEGQPLNNNFYWFRIMHNGDLGFVHRDAIVAPRELPHC